MSRRIYFREIRDHDLKHDTTFIRELEFSVDGLAREQGYILQFWRDMSTYGLREAILYLRNSHPDSDYTYIDAIAERIVKAVK